ncbi:hypothetical protein E2562_014517 [Oryza meyeriana var. granulata]|uniref:F-box domain-containing protein n=1 Tax=Oryza meyeriana var. granulata TaxID=110450 RepID=A0A6G1EJX7_9ORYZ|nr:hypothetical protein E2562_014517 [Oryza meyeriana var. granulata]
MEKEIAALPDDALAGVLGCLPARSLAAARCVCKAWLAVVDSRALLLPHLLPRSVRGMFINYIDHYRPHLFARPSSAAAAAASPCNSIDGMLGFLPHGRYDSDGAGRDWWSVVDHCNGLVLCDVQWGSRLAVCNPATRRWTLAPPLEETIRYHCCAYLAFDPAVSPHYDVLAKVFSSRTGPRGRWEERAFVREGEPAGTVEDIRLHDEEPTWTGPRQRLIFKNSKEMAIDFDTPWFNVFQ